MRKVLVLLIFLTGVHTASAAERDNPSPGVETKGKIYVLAPQGHMACITQIWNLPAEGSHQVATPENPVRCRIGGGSGSSAPASENAAATLK